MRFHNPKRGTDIFLPALCGNYYCVRCPAFQVLWRGYRRFQDALILAEQLAGVA